MVAHPTRLVMVGAAALIALAGCTASEAEPLQTPSASGSASASASATDDLAAFYGQQVRWEGCGGDFDCTKLKVPADYDNPGGGSLELDVVRVKTRDPRGSLILNPGGPGGSGVEYARAARAVLTPQLADAYDVVGFDPRGVVSSSPVDCIDDSKLDALFASDGTPDTPEEVAELAATSKLFGVGCESKSPDVAPYMDTESAARDMDILRAVLGDEKLNYLGKSYGTYLGAQYAELFPERVGKFVLDGVLPSSLDSDEITLGQAKAFDVVLRRFVEDCITQEDCPLPRDVDAGSGSDPAVPGRPRPEPDPRHRGPHAHRGPWDLRDPELPVLPAERLGHPAVRPRCGLPGRRQRAHGHDGRPDPAQPDGTFANNGNEAFYAVSCLDRPAVGGVDHAAELAEQWAPRRRCSARTSAWGNLPCWQWPMGAGTAEAAGDPRGVPGAGLGADPGGDHEVRPRHPVRVGCAGGRRARQRDAADYDGDGHTAYTSGSSCIDRAVDAYFLEGTMPAEGTVCTADAGSFRAQAPPMGNGQPGNFAAWFLTGLVVWNLFAQATTGSLNSIEGMGAMLQKVFIPSYIPSFAATVTILVEKAMESLVLVVVLLYFQNIGWTWLLYPFLVALLGVFAAAVGYMLAVANVHFRDTGQIYTIVMQLFFFLTPLMYPLEMVPETWNGVPLQQLILINPLTSFVGIGRSLMYDLALPPANMVLYALGWTVAAALAARFVYARWGRDVNEAI